jgi:two-component system, response regulator
MASLEQIEILLVEDSAEDAEMTLRALRKKHLANHVHWVRDGEEALAVLRNSRAPKLVMLDLKMPKVDGIEVLRQLKARPETRAIPVVVMTSSNEERDVVEAYRLGVNSYIVKPVAFESFRDTVSKIGLYWLLSNRTPQ